MSREIRELSTEQVAKLIYVRCCECFGPGHEEMSVTIIAQEIERLLAQERPMKLSQACEICWTTSWVPVSDDDPDAQKLLNVKGSVRCDHCWLKERYRELEQKVESRLAQEREPMECGHPKACWADEGDCLIKVEEGGPPLHSVSMRRPRKYCSACAEREKVRKQCAEHLDKVAELCGTARYEGLLRLRYEAAAREIRQLDLTKLDEGGEEKGNG